MNKIFISYSHKDEEWKDRLVDHLKTLEVERRVSVWDDRRITPGSKWNQEVERALNEASAVVLLISADFLSSHFIMNVEMPRLLERRAREGLRIIPLIVRACAWEKVDWLKVLQAGPKDAKPLAQFSEPEIDSILTNFALEIKNLFNQTKQQETASMKISISKLPTTGQHLFGRERELARLAEAWEDEGTCLVTLIAWGGVGKTALVNHWLNLMAKDNYRAAEKVYGWSFYSQGAEEGKQASADEFMQETLKWFGDPRPGEGTPVEKGRRLARLVGKQKTLLILDGLEPLQYPPGEVHGFEGTLKDQGMRAFLRELTGSSPGLCVITTRERVTDLADKLEFPVKEMPLENLSPGAGAQLLRNLGVEGMEKEILEAVREYNGHALALTLLGNYIKSVFKGDIRQRDRIPQLTRDKRLGGHARRVMEAYNRWLGESPERDILYIMGLFDRPAAKGAIEALKSDPPIPGVTEQLQQLSEEDWGYALANLRGANLLAKEDPHKPDFLDCHPLIREHFGEKLREENPGGWKETHTRLYHYYKNLPEKELPDTLPEMEPLFAAVAHGCMAGLHQETLDDVYWQRIRRGNEAYTLHKLGAFGADLAVLSHFFQVPWSQPAASLKEEDKAFMLNEAGFGLRAVGRLQEAIQPMKAGLEMRINQKVWDGASKNAGNLSELLLTLGEVSQAVEVARQGVTHADRHGDDFQREARRTTLADALHQSGQIKEAEKWFREAEEMQKQRQPEFPFLYSVQGFQFCDLLLEQGRHQEVEERAEAAIKIAQRNGWLLHIALDRLSLGRTWMIKTMAEKTGDFTTAEEYLQQAVAGLRNAGQQQYLPPGLFARAECYRHQQKFKEAWEDLHEAKEIAQLGSMKLHLADYHLEAGKLCEAQGKQQDAHEHFTTAKEMMEEMGYKRKLMGVNKALGK